MFISQIQIAAMNRANMVETERKDFFLYVDEFQNFATTSFIKILSEARKYRLNLILANQYTAQLPTEIQDAIFGNAGTLISFVVGAADANRLMNELGNFYTQDDLVGLARYQIIVKISVNASISNPFSATTLPLPEIKDDNRQKIIAASEEQYYRKTEALDMTQASIYVPNAPPQTRSYSSATPYRPQQQTPSSTIKRSEPIKPSPVVPSKEPTLEELDKDRSDGLRPSVVGCFLNSGKILFVYQKTHQLWQLPQGGVDNHETTIDAFKREMTEELG